jgi:Leucine-rich repeat (LRR) protein
MGNCLVTKLAGSVNNPSLLKLGEMKVTSNLTSIGNSGDYIRVDGSTDKPVTLKMETGYFRASKSSNDSVGTEMTVNSAMEIFPSTGEHVISVIPKYNIQWLQNVAMDIGGLKFSKDLKSLLLLPSSYGDISSLKDLTALAYIIASNSKLYGDISSLKDLTALTSFRMLNTQVSGDIASLGTLTNLTYFELSSTDKIVGDISSLKTLSKLESFKLKGNNIYGDLATIPAQCKFASFSANAKFTWGTRPSSSKILAIENAPIISNIDKMLQDQAACQTGITSSDITYYKAITATGTRTSASDAAVQTLQSKGYTVSITPA